MTTAAAVAVLGLGAMGLPMATNLSKGFAVRGFDIASERLAIAERAGVAPAATAAEAVSGADVVLVGEAIIRSTDPQQFVAELVAAGAHPALIPSAHREVL